MGSVISKEGPRVELRFGGAGSDFIRPKASPSPEVTAVTSASNCPWVPPKPFRELPSLSTPRSLCLARLIHSLLSSFRFVLEDALSLLAPSWDHPYGRPQGEEQIPSFYCPACNTLLTLPWRQTGVCCHLRLPWETDLLEITETDLCIPRAQHGAYSRHSNARCK